MMTADKPKRRWFPFWRLATIPLCPEHGVPCIARGTINTEAGPRYQKRYCPVPGCRHSVKTPIPRG
jgi:hypothetical protein